MCVIFNFPVETFGSFITQVWLGQDDTFVTKGMLLDLANAKDLFKKKEKTCTCKYSVSLFTAITMKTILLASTPGINFRENVTPRLTFHPQRQQARSKTRPVLTFGRKPWLYVPLTDESAKVKDMLELNPPGEDEEKLVNDFQKLAKQVKSNNEKASKTNDNEFDKAAKRYFAEVSENRQDSQGFKKPPPPPSIIPVSGLGNISGAATSAATAPKSTTLQSGKSVASKPRKRKDISVSAKKKTKSTTATVNSQQDKKRQKKDKDTASKTIKGVKLPHFKVSKA